MPRKLLGYSQALFVRIFCLVSHSLKRNTVLLYRHVLLARYVENIYILYRDVPKHFPLGGGVLTI